MSSGTRKRDPEKEKYWREVIARWQESGLSKSQFCAQENIKMASFCNWVSITARRDIEARREAAQAQLQKRREQKRISRQKKRSSDAVEAKLSAKKTASPTSESSFVPVVFAGSARPPRKEEPVLEIRLHLATLVVFAGADTETLRAVITACRELWY